MKLGFLLETILSEGEIDNIIKNKKEQLSKTKMGESSKFYDEFDYYSKEFIKNIPTPKKYIAKFFDLIKDYYNSSGHNMSIQHAFEFIYIYFKKWMDYKTKNKINADIISQTPESLFDIVDQIEKTEKFKELENKVDKIYDDGRWLVVKIKSQEASCKYGANTQWCISAKYDNRYYGHGYSENNHIYFVIDKKEKVNEEDVLYKMAILVNKNSRKIEVWNAEDKLLNYEQVNILHRFIPEIFEAIGNDVSKIDIDYIKKHDSYSIREIKMYKRTSFKEVGDKMIIMTYEREFVNHYIKTIIDLDENIISSRFLYSKLINDPEIGETYYDYKETTLESVIIDEPITKSNFKINIRKSVIDLLNTPEVKKYFKDYPDEYFSGIKLYQGLETMGNSKVPQKALITAIKLLKEKGEQNITSIRRIVDPKLMSSQNVRPLLRSLYSFGLIKLEKRGRNVMIVPTPKLIKNPLEKLI